MRKVIASIDVGSDTIKLVIGEFVRERLHILYASKKDNYSVIDGKLANSESFKEKIKELLMDASTALGIPIKKVILGLNLPKMKLIKSVNGILVKGENSIITGDDITNVINKCADGKVEVGYTLIGVIPVEFSLDNSVVIGSPKGKKSEKLYLKSIVATAPKDYVNSFLKAVEEAGFIVVDIMPNAVGEYYPYQIRDGEKKSGALINLGYETTTVSIFKRGLLTSSKVSKMGGINIINDISFIYKIDMNTSRALYKDLILASSKLANPKEIEVVNDIEGTKVRINQHELSQIAESRLTEILNLAKKQINILTKKEISYIIVTGGLTELRDFKITLENVFGKIAQIGNMNIIGARDNAFSSSVGLIKYFDKKLLLRDKTFSIFSESELALMNNPGVKADTNNNQSLLSKVFGYFFDS